MIAQQNGKNAKKIVADDLKKREPVDEDELLPERDSNLLCSIVDKCRACTFKELQIMPECRQTGFRLIKRCVERETNSNKVVEDNYLNEGCQLFNGTLDEFTSDPKH